MNAGKPKRWRVRLERKGAGDGLTSGAVPAPGEVMWNEEGKPLFVVEARDDGPRYLIVVLEERAPE